MFSYFTFSSLFKLGSLWPSLYDVIIQSPFGVLPFLAAFILHPVRYGPHERRLLRPASPSASVQRAAAHSELLR